MCLEHQSGHCSRLAGRLQLHSPYTGAVSSGVQSMKCKYRSVLIMFLISRATVLDLQVAAESPVVGDRAHILLLLSNVAVAEPGSASSSGNSSNPLRLQSVITWIGTSPADQAAEAWPEPTPQQQAAEQQADATANVLVTFGYVRSAVAVIAAAPDDALQLQQLVLGQLSQGPALTAAAAVGGAHIPKELWTMLLWCIDRYDAVVDWEWLAPLTSR